MSRGLDHLIVLTRYPEPGSTKTRLIPALGPVGAAVLQRCMTERIIQCARALQRRGVCSVEVRFEGGHAAAMAAWLGPDLIYRRQGAGDIGERMHRAFKTRFDEGAARAVLVGTDVPNLTAAILLRAFAALQESHVVIGPATDGGYYLIGLRRPNRSLFSGIPWGTESVLTRTMKVAEALGLTVTCVDILHDVDRVEDLRVWRSLHE